MTSDHDKPLPSLWHNGALDPDQWRPSSDNLKHSYGRALCEEGDLVGWRYGAWRVIEVRIREDHDLSDEDRAKMHRHVDGLRAEFRPRAWAKSRPRHVVLRHESGPLILKPGEKTQRLHDGTRTLHFGTKACNNDVWAVLDEPYKTCSCHGHIWPCQDIDRNTLALHEARKTDKLIATTDPDTCAHCLEVITTRQKSLTFPEESRFVPGAPGPTFHAGRVECWRAAEKYEREGRLVDNPDVVRLASCPGIRFIHEARNLTGADRLDCTAGPFCTGAHGPAAYASPCWHQIDIAGNDGAYARPSFDCGYRMAPHRACIGADLSGGGSSISPMAADLLREQRNSR